MGFMACSRWLDQTGMYLKNEYSVFKGHPDFRPYKVSLTRILRFRVGLVGALWLSLQDYIRFVLIFSVSYAVGLGQKKYLVGFPTRHRRRFYLIRLHIMHPKICFTKFACFFPERLNWSYAPSAWIISISISGAVMTFTTSIFCSYALLNRNSSLRESKIRITEICLSNPFRKYYA